jgi:hypothetical protein
MRHCLTCKALERYTWLDPLGYCFKCSPRKWAVEQVLSMLINDSQGPYTWAEWAEVARKVSQLDMGCVFTSCGCTLKTDPNPRGCCTGCAEKLGYLKNIPAEAHDLLLSRYHKEDGFWTSNGCSIPWEYRSPVCLSYRCKSLRDAEEKTVWAGFYKAVGLLEKEYVDHLETMLKLQESDHE